MPPRPPPRPPRPNAPSTTPPPCPQVPPTLALSICVLGASGDLARKKTYPALFALFSKGFLPVNLQVVGYARSAMTKEQFHNEHLRPNLKGDPGKIESFLDLCSYINGEVGIGCGWGPVPMHTGVVGVDGGWGPALQP